MHDNAVMKPGYFVCKVEKLIKRIVNTNHPLSTHNPLVVSVVLFINQKYRQRRDCYITLQTGKLRQRLGI